MSRSYAGLRVVELAEVWAGPFGCSLLGDLGADVVKVETYPRPSVTRPLREEDRKIKTEADAEASMRQVLQELGEIRVEYDLPAVCPT